MYRRNKIVGTTDFFHGVKFWKNLMASLNFKVDVTWCQQLDQSVV